MIRVVRILEYIYSDAEKMADDMGRWGVGANATQWQGRMTIRSATMLPEVLGSQSEAIEIGREAMERSLRFFTSVLEEDPKPDLDQPAAVEAWLIRDAGFAADVIPQIRAALENWPRP